MRNLNEILVEMKALVEELESHIGKPKEEIGKKESDLYFASLDNIQVDDNMSFTFPAAQPTLRVDDTISLYEIK